MMKHTKDVEELVERSYLNNLHIPADSEMDERILGDAVTRMEEAREAGSASAGPSVWRIIMKSRTTKLTTAAVIAVVIIVGIVNLGEPVGGASVVFAAAMDSVRQARTFSCTEITERPYRDGDGQERGKFLFKQRWMFKEPDWERREMPKSPWGEVQNEVTITHYGTRQRLRLKPVEKKAILHDMSSDYTVDDKTGEVVLTRLRTGLRDRLLKTSAGAVDDLGEAVLDGKSVRVLQSRKGNRLTTVWIDLETKHPVKIEHKWTDQSRSPLTYAGIQIDTELDDDLFSLEPPEGYTVKLTGALYADEIQKMLAKIMHMGKLCLIYRSNVNNVFPDELGDLVTAGITSDAALKKMLAAPNAPDGPPVIRYRQPDTKATDWGMEVMLYEARQEGTGDGRVMVVMLDSHAELMPVQTLAQFLKPWPEPKKKLSANMTRLHWFCDRYTKEHGGKYPTKLEDIVGAEVWEELVGTEVSEDIIRRLQAPWGQPDAPAVIRYRPPGAEAEPSSEVILSEIYDQWPNDGAVVCYADGHCEIIPEESRFEELTR
jgi:outer membrane lipoprotein-sorting protein